MDESSVVTYWVIYNNPSDFPGNFVVRRHFRVVGFKTMYAEEEPVIVTDSIDQARSAIPDTCSNKGRHDEDDPHIVEVWKLPT